MKWRHMAKGASDGPIIVYGVHCTWWDDIGKICRLPSQSGHSLPCCPHCYGLLFQQDEPKWWADVDKFEADGHPGYRAMIEWQRGKCFPNTTAMKDAYARRGLL